MFVDDLVAKVVGHVEMPHRIQISGWLRGVEAMDVKADMIGAEEVAEHFGHRRRDGTVGRGIFGVVGRGQKRPPAGLFNGRRVGVIVAGHRAETVGRYRGRIDRGDRPPKQVVILRMQAGHQRIGADEVDHRQQPCRLEQVQAALAGNVAAEPIVLADHVRRPKLGDSCFLIAAHAAGCSAVGLDLIECLYPLVALKRWWWIRKELIQALQQKWANGSHPRSLRRSERWG